MSLDIVIFGLSITSSWGNGHATTYRALVKALAARGHTVTFFERDAPWYSEHRDLPKPPFCKTELYGSVEEVIRGHAAKVRGADLVVVGSFVPDGIAIGEFVTRQARGVTAFYDIDTPVTLAKLATGAVDYINPALIRRYGLYLSFTGGPVLDQIERMYGSPRARALYCAVDPEQHVAMDLPHCWTLGYLGTYSADRQPTLERLLIAPARALPDREFVIAGPQYPEGIDWPSNVERIWHLPPSDHPGFYSSQRFTLNVTRADMIAAGYSPSVRLFEAAACGAPIISDRWSGLETILTPGEEILIADRAEDVVAILRDLPEARRRSIAAKARKRVLQAHTAEHRAKALETYYQEAKGATAAKSVEAVA